MQVTFDRLYGRFQFGNTGKRLITVLTSCPFLRSHLRIKTSPTTLPK